MNYLSPKQILFSLLIGLTLGFGLSKIYPTVEIKEVEKVVYKQTKESKLGIDKRITINKDGSRVIEFKKHQETHSQTDLNQTKQTSTTTNNPKWLIGVNYQPPIYRLQSESITDNLQKQFIGSVYVGFSVSTEKRVGVSVLVGF